MRTRCTAAKHYVILSNELQCRSSPCSDLLSHVPHTHTHSARGTHVATHISGTASSDAGGWREKSIRDLAVFSFVQVSDRCTHAHALTVSQSFCVLSRHTPPTNPQPTCGCAPTGRGPTPRAGSRAWQPRRGARSRHRAARERPAAPAAPRPHPPPPRATRARGGGARAARAPGAVYGQRPI